LACCPFCHEGKNRAARGGKVRLAPQVKFSLRLKVKGVVAAHNSYIAALFY